MSENLCETHIFTEQAYSSVLGGAPAPTQEGQISGIGTSSQKSHCTLRLLQMAE